MADLLDSYSETNRNADRNLKSLHPSNSDYSSQVGQTFNCPGVYKITSAEFFMSKVGNPTGMGHAVLYAHTGTYGVDGVPTGPVLATSDGVDVSTLVYGLNTFTFTGAQQYIMASGTKYCILFENPTSGTIDEVNYPKVGQDNLDPTHAGNRLEYVNGAHVAVPDRDAVFYVYGEAVVMACTNPPGNEGNIICGNPDYGQDPTHRYECQCVGYICNWVDLGYSSDCDIQPCINPSGQHGAIICGDPAYGQDPTHRYQCVDGVWTDLGYSPDCDVEEPCINPSGVHGAIICGDPAYGQDSTHRYQCVDGVWTDLGYSSDCDVPPPPQIPVWVWPLLFGGAILGGAIIYKIVKKKR